MRTKSATAITTENDRSLAKNRKERKKPSVPALGVIT